MNKSKNISPVIVVDDVRIERIPVRTRILTSEDDIARIIREYALPLLQEGDILTISESPLAITQGRAVPADQIKPGWLAKFLAGKVMKVPYGIGLGAPTSMQCAIDECGAPRILLAAMVGAVTKFFGRSGDFYRLAGMQAALIDAAETSPVEPYTHTVIKGPLNPGKVAQELADEFGLPVAVMDINDIGGSWVIGASRGVSKHFLELVMKDNPQGQSDELTPLCIVRKLD
ncbi:MAG: coenzyme F420-0:L-glutamate ligase [Candidatus Syntrophosphaera sp.]|nr:coenzyme F420-0:L-glutamate ligase [Candidatus Syntrophosphaera sp.]